MCRPKPGDVLFWSLATVAAVLLVFSFLVLAGAVPIGTEDPPVEGLPPAAAPSAATTAAEEPVARPRPAERPSSTTSKTASRLVTVVVTATRGDCWLAARAGSETGPVLEERLLVQGESVRLRAARVWLSLGASGNVDVLVDQQPREVPAGTVALVLGPSSTS